MSVLENVLNWFFEHVLKTNYVRFGTRFEDYTCSKTDREQHLSFKGYHRQKLKKISKDRDFVKNKTVVSAKIQWNQPIPWKGKYIYGTVSIYDKQGIYNVKSFKSIVSIECNLKQLSLLTRKSATKFLDTSTGVNKLTGKRPKHSSKKNKTCFVLSRQIVTRGVFIS